MIIKMLDNEYWWGGIVNLGTEMPYSKESDHECDITTIKLSLDQSAPLFISSKGRYLWSEKPFKATFWHGEIRIPDIYDVSLIAAGDTLKDAHQAVMKQYYQRDTKAIPDERYFRVPQYNTWIELGENQTEQGVLQYARNVIQNELPAGILMIDNGWQCGLGDWRFHPGRFPHPKEMIDELHALGFKVMLWTLPLVRKQETEDFEMLCEKHILIRDANGEVAKRWWWGGYDYMLDLTSSAANAWYHGQLAALMQEYGVDGFKLDGGDSYFYDDGDQTAQLITAHEHTRLFNQFGLQYRFHEFRAGYNCGCAPYVFRLQDKEHTWNGSGLNCVIPNSILQGLIGNFYHCPDMIGGGSLNDLFETSFDPELYIRWVQANALCPMMQFSLAPWRVLTPEQLDIVKDMVALHQEYSVYILQLARRCAETNEPIMRHLAYQFPGENLETINDQFMLGERILVAPVITKGAGKRRVSLPAGEWKADDGTIYQGGQAIEVEAPLARLPYFVRQD